ncbi:hypothetical protein ACJA29_01470 [Metamycoplasma sualvi]|uniref:hypothetical protein n=1 Tax=Metamycoplasma sualvi TaxID=2125 RepID=UPI003873A581
MKLKQLLISTASIAALVVIPMSIVSCGNNNNNAVEGIPPANDGDNKPGEDNNNQPGGSTGGSDNAGDNSTPGNGDNSNSNPGGSTGGSDNGGNNNNQPGWDVDTSSKYINVNSKDGMAAYILANSNIAFEFIKKALNRPSYKTVPFSHQWTDKLTSLVYDKGMITTKDNNYTYYNVKSITFTYVGGPVLNYQFYENNTLQKGIISTRDGGVITLSVDLHFRSKTNFIGG